MEKELIELQSDLPVFRRLRPNCRRESHLKGDAEQNKLIGNLNSQINPFHIREFIILNEFLTKY